MEREEKPIARVLRRGAEDATTADIAQFSIFAKLWRNPEFSRLLMSVAPKDGVCAKH
jgi:hypothetical protein